MSSPLPIWMLWLKTHKDTPKEKWNAQLKKCLGELADTEEGHVLFRVCNSLTLSKELLYLSMTPKGELEGVLAFLVPASQCMATLNGVHHDAGHQGQQQMLTLAQECFWWPMIVEVCKALVQSCSRCHAFEGVILKAPLCPIRAYTPLKLVHMDFNSIESTMKLNKPPSMKNVLIITDHFTRYTLAIVMKDQTDKTVAKILYERFIVVFGMPAKLISD